MLEWLPMSHDPFWKLGKRGRFLLGRPCLNIASRPGIRRIHVSPPPSAFCIACNSSCTVSRTKGVGVGIIANLALPTWHVRAPFGWWTNASMSGVLKGSVGLGKSGQASCSCCEDSKTAGNVPFRQTIIVQGGNQYGCGSKMGTQKAQNEILKPRWSKFDP